MKKRLLTMIMCVLLAVIPSACSAPDEDAAADTGVTGSVQSSETEAPEETDENSEEETIEMKMTINDTAVQVAWENNASARALADLAKSGSVTIQMNAYGGFEQVGPIGTALPSSDTNIKTKAGDIMLYTSDHMVIFYGSNSWAYTRLGKITDKSQSELEELLSGRGVTVTVTAD